MTDGNGGAWDGFGSSITSPANDTVAHLQELHQFAAGATRMIDGAAATPDLAQSAGLSARANGGACSLDLAKHSSSAVTEGEVDISAFVLLEPVATVAENATFRSTFMTTYHPSITLP